ncbi:hypothetical protein PVK06_040536 [Gossypium arboreum]|uniref:RNase H type-1 domain-containing protein n=1 Tax=Gossypium arboreum TaxID=29729 RepID=A0ABR0N5U5_GOSAR|nr:hypothetical protein PVK06_040536 [Gossypium arboreum]
MAIFGGNYAHAKLFAVLCWLMWKNRNKFIFQQISNRPNKIVYRVEYFVSNIHESLLSSGSLGINQSVRVKWHPPCSGWVKVSVDGSYNMNRHCLMVGGVVRDSARNWLEVFRKYIGRGSTLKSELWPILTGIEVALLRNYSKIIVKSDCLDAIEMNWEIL